MTNLPLLASINVRYFTQLLKWKKIPYQMVHNLFKVDGFSEYNHLIEVNKIFSAEPSGELVDRTCTIKSPLKFKVFRPWQVPTHNKKLNETFHSRVKYYTDQNCQLNLFWSGGADSTAMVVSFLTHSPNLDQLVLVYSPYSLYENRDFFEFIIKKFPNLKTLDISGDVYLNNNFEGIIITGHGGDEFTASLDDSFFNKLGSVGLMQSWQDFFYKETSNQPLIDFCEEYFSKAVRPITTVLDARWWFYASNKSQIFGPRDIAFVLNQADVSLSKFSSFYDCQEFEDYMWHNIDKIIEPNGDYKTYKKFLRQYIYNFYPNLDYLENTAKVNSMQFQYYYRKKLELLDLHWICMLEDTTTIRTKNLPLLSKKEFDAEYGHSLDYLFNNPQ